MASSFFLLVTVAAFFLAFAEGRELAAADALGCPDATVRVVATEDSPTMPFVGPSRLTEAVTGFAADRRLSVAFSSDNEPDLITLLDPHGRFALLDTQLQEKFTAEASGPVAALSSSVAQANRSALLPPGVSSVGDFSPTVSFDGLGYPAMLYSPAVAPFDSGVYLIAGADLSDLASVVRLFERNGMEVQNVAVQEPVTLANRLNGVYGGIVISLAVALVVGAILAVRIHASFDRDQLETIAVLGASRGELNVHVLCNLVPQVLAGLIIGAGVCLIGAIGVLHLLLATFGAAVASVMAAMGACVALWILILSWVAASETKRCQRVVVC